MESSDRTKLKDKIIENISKAIKSIQELLYYQSKDPVLAGSVVTLCNGDLACNKLCENLDHALLHGLKKVTYGYWQVVKQLSHKQMVKEIDSLDNVTTELGKGRAWLYASLNEGNLESYIRLLCANDKLLKKYYAKEALMLDEDRMNILLTHTSGLEYVSFQLEYNVPYLDLSAYPPHSNIRSEPEDIDCSYSPQLHGRFNSVHSIQETRASPLESISQPSSDSDSASNASLDTHSHSDIACQMKGSTISSDSGCHTDALIDNARHLRTTPVETIIKEQIGGSADSVSLCSVDSAGDFDRLKRLENMIVPGDDDDNGEDSFHVIRMKSKKVSGKLRKKKLSQSSKNNAGKTTENIEFDSQKINETSNGGARYRSDSDFATKESEKLQLENDYLTHCDNNYSKMAQNSAFYDGQPETQSSLASITKFDSGIDVSDSGKFDNSNPPQSTNISDLSLLRDKELQQRSSPHLQNNSQTVKAQIENRIAEICKVDNLHSSSHKVTSAELQSGIDCVTDSNNDQNVSNSSEIPTDSKQSYNISNSPAVKFLNSYSQRNLNKESSTEQQNIYSPTKQKNNNKVKVEAPKDSTSLSKPVQDVEDNFDVYSSTTHDNQKHSSNEPMPSQVVMNHSSVHSAAKLMDYMDYILTTPDSPPTESKIVDNVQEEVVDLSLSLDNNTKLQLMLDIFTNEDEQLLKMFVTRENHPEGDAHVVFVLISTHCLYLLNYRRSSKKFVMQTMAKLQDLLFISTGINDQTLNIESIGKNNQKQRFWLTPGHQALTLSIVTCLTEAVKAASEHLLPAKSRFSVESEIPMQIIILRKYITAELQCEAQDVTISDYSLVFWEDASAPSNQSLDADAAYKEGTLYLRSQDPLKSHVWKLVYIVLKNSMLCVSNKKSDPRPHSYLGLGGDQCVGCRLTTTDRAHSLELILAQGGSWYLAAASQTEIYEWRHALCLAVSQGTVENNTLSACIPCGSVLSCNHLFLCHEDIHTKFYRTLGRAHLEDITGIACEDDSTYCVIEFESQETGILSNHWVVYLSSVQDLQRYRNALSAAWRQIYMIELPVSKVIKASLQHHCSAISDQLKQELTLY